MPARSAGAGLRARSIGPTFINRPILPGRSEPVVSVTFVTEKVYRGSVLTPPTNHQPDRKNSGKIRDRLDTPLPLK